MTQINWHPLGTNGPWRACHRGDCSCGQIWSETTDQCVATAWDKWGDDIAHPYGSNGPEAQTVNARAIAEVPVMVMALRELADDLESELQDKYPPEMVAQYPVIKRRFDRDMASVAKARAILARIDGDAGHKQREEQQP